MKIHSIKLRHCSHFSDLNIEFKYSNKPITLILGDQSSGKTAIIKNIYQALTWFPARLKDARTAGVVMLDSDISQDRVQSRIQMNIQIPDDIGSLSESFSSQDKNVSTCSWILYKTLNAQGLGHSKVDTPQLEQLTDLYNKAILQDPLQGLPLIAYYPSDRFVNEMNLISKNNPAVFQYHSAYELAPLPYTTFARFFEWFREINDIENAQMAQLFQKILQTTQGKDSTVFDDETVNLNQKLFQAHAQMHAPSMVALKKALNTVFPDLTDLYIEYLPKLQLMVNYQGQLMSFSQLSNSMKNWIALIGDVVRRLCLLNPNQLYPCMEGDGTLLIDNIDAQLDQDTTQNILQRLHQAFPQLQIIATGCSQDLLEHAEQYQYFKLDQKKLYEVDLSSHKNNLDTLYQNVLHTLEPNQDDALLSAEINSNAPQQMFEKFQDLSPEQQLEFLQLIQDGDAYKPAKI